MSDISVTVAGGSSKRLKTAGKYCDRDIVVTAEGGGGGDIDALLDGTIIEIESNATSIYKYGLYYRQQLKRAIFPKLKTAGDYAFSWCTALEEIEIPLCEALGSRVFYNSGPFSKIVFPKVSSFGTYSVSTSKFDLKIIDIYSKFSAETNAFSNNVYLVALILRSSELCSISSTNVLSNTKITNDGTGYIYVPRALVESYKVATNWSTMASQFRALEDYTVDGTITGELDPSKI